MRALISVSDKGGVVEFARALHGLGYEIVSTGGTYEALKSAGIHVLSVTDITGFPECLSGRVKTLHPAVHGGLLARRDDGEHMAQIEKLGIKPIDIVAINLYPFKETICKEGVTLPLAIENIDIGGPAMLRSAAKNHADVIVVCNPSDYEAVTAELKSDTGLSYEARYRLALKVFEHTAAYDAMIAEYLRAEKSIPLPDNPTFTYEIVQGLRYGENPHQCAAYYKEIRPHAGALTGAEQLHGKGLSFNNINDTNGALACLREFSVQVGGGSDENSQACPSEASGSSAGRSASRQAHPLATVVAVKHANPCGGESDENSQACLSEASGSSAGRSVSSQAHPLATVVAVKHANPCGVGSAGTIAEAYRKAYEADPVSIFGGIIAANMPIDKEAAEEISKIFAEIVIAPDFTEEALDVLTRKQGIRLLKLADIREPAPAGSIDIKKVDGGILVQNIDDELFDETGLSVVTKKAPTEQEFQDLIFAMKVVKHVKSNAIVVAKGGMTLGVGPGQTNRISAARIALVGPDIEGGPRDMRGAVMASDAFFPFEDCVEAAAAAGVTAIIQPGGSMNDGASIKKCDKLGLAMVFTDMRHFKH